jgi:hypothetical protein
MICESCGGTDKEVKFNKITRPDGTLYWYKRCAECKYKKDKARQKAQAEGTVLKGRKQMAKRPRISSVWVLWCPKDAYQRGSFFNRSEFKATLREGYWPLGMLVKIREQKYAVCGSGVVARTWKRLGYPLNVEWTEQWLMEVNGRARV